jgi:hypothetical protein
MSPLGVSPLEASPHQRPAHCLRISGWGRPVLAPVVVAKSAAGLRPSIDKETRV